MPKLRALALRILGLLPGRRGEDDFSAELESHIALDVDDGMRSGLTAEEARREALIRLGGAEQTRQAHRERERFTWIDSLLQDIGYGLRTLRKNPGFAVTAVLTLALGIGACTAMFSVLNAVLLRSLPYGDAERLVYVLTPNPHLGADVPIEASGPSYADFFDIQKQNRSFASMTAFEQTSFNLIAPAGAVPIGGARVDGHFFSTLASIPELGRAVLPGDDRVGHNRVVVISYALWQSMFAGSSQILGRSLRLDRESYEIIGVMPAEFGYPHTSDFPPGVGDGYGAQTDVWIPLALASEQKANRDGASGFAIARLRPGVSVAQAQAEMSTVMKQLDVLHSADLRGWEGAVKPMLESSIGPQRKLMWLLLGAVACVLLIACGNAANLLLARAAARTHELGVRLTLGASKGRIVRQLLTESLLLGLSAGIVGVAIAYVSLYGLLRISPGNIPRLEEASIDGRVLLFTLLASVMTGVVFGVLPAILSARSSAVESLKRTGSRGSVGTCSRVRNLLVIGELALVVSLLAGAGLLLRSYAKVVSVKTGFSASTLTMRVAPDAQYDSREKRLALVRNLAFAHKYFANRDPLGLRVRASESDGPWKTVVGVVGDVHHSSLEAPVLPVLYEALWQNDIDGSAVVVRSALPPNSMVASLRKALGQVDPNLAFSGIETMADLATQATARRRFQTTLFTVFAATALLLGAVGIYGVLAYSVQRRTAEIGVRIALGASRGRVLGLVLFEGLRMASLGLLLGVGGALVLTRLLAASLFEVSPFDPVTYFAAPALLLVVVAGACLVPARRAAFVDPMQALRAE